ncbi:MAG: putative 2-dehydropantoate 2-reductase [Mangrovibacterium sp.]
MNKLTYAVVGTGGLGGYYGGRLAHAGRDVHFLLHSDYEQVKQNGLQVYSVNGDFHLQHPCVYSRTENMPVCDVILICLKTTSNKLLKELLPPLLHQQSLVILLQNGLGVEAELDRLIPGLNLAGGLAFICSWKSAPGVIRHADLGKLSLGSYNLKSERVLEQVCTDFTSSGVPCNLSANLYASRWHKLLWNVPFNGLTVVMNTTTDRLMNHPSSRQLVLDLMLEVVCAARQCGVPLEEKQAYSMVEMTDRMTPYAPSMKLDYDNRRPLEVEAIYSRPIKEAAGAGYAMNAVAMLEKQLRFIQSLM